MTPIRCRMPAAAPKRRAAASVVACRLRLTDPGNRARRDAQEGPVSAARARGRHARRARPDPARPERSRRWRARQCVASIARPGRLDDLVCPSASRDELAAPQQRFGHRSDSFERTRRVAERSTAIADFARFFGCDGSPAINATASAENADTSLHGTRPCGLSDVGLSRSSAFCGCVIPCAATQCPSRGRRSARACARPAARASSSSRSRGRLARRLAHLGHPSAMPARFGSAAI